MRKTPFAGVELTSQRVRGLRGTSELPGRPAMYLSMYVFLYLCTYLRMYVCRHITPVVCIHAWSSHIVGYRLNHVANPVRGQLCTQASLQLHLYTSSTNNHTPWAHTERPTSAQAYVDTREITKIHQYTGKLKHPCALCASLRLSTPNTVRVQVQRASPSTREPTHNRCIAQAVHAKYVVQAQCVHKSTRTHVHFAA